MSTLLSSPAAPFVALSLAGVFLAVAGLLQLHQIQTLLTGLRTLPGMQTIQGRLLLGQLAALPLTGLLLSAALNTASTARLLLGASALGLWLFVGVVLPRRPLVAAQQEQRRLRRLTPALVATIRVAKAGNDSNLAILERYVTRTNPRQAVMQQVVTDALRLLAERRASLPFRALATVARARGCRELIDVTEALAQAEVTGHEIESVLAAQETMLDAILRDEFARQVQQRGLLITAVSAGGMVAGLFGGMLWVIIAGSGLLGL